jgi:hypothetical protein
MIEYVAMVEVAVVLGCAVKIRLAIVLLLQLAFGKRAVFIWWCVVVPCPVR